MRKLIPIIAIALVMAITLAITPTPTLTQQAPSSQGKPQIRP